MYLQKILCDMGYAMTTRDDYVGLMHEYKYKYKHTGSYTLRPIPAHLFAGLAVSLAPCILCVCIDLCSGMDTLSINTYSHLSVYLCVSLSLYARLSGHAVCMGRCLLQEHVRVIKETLCFCSLDPAGV